MDSSRAKMVAGVIVVLAIVLVLGLALAKFSGAAKQPGGITPLSGYQKIDQLEKSPGVTTPQGANFMQRESNRRHDTQSVMDETLGGE
jgi:hypothetical protein